MKIPYLYPKNQSRNNNNGLGHPATEFYDIIVYPVLVFKKHLITL
jgi:hypothetical protein